MGAEPRNSAPAATVTAPALLNTPVVSSPAFMLNTPVAVLVKAGWRLGGVAVVKFLVKLPELMNDVLPPPLAIGVAAVEPAAIVQDTPAVCGLMIAEPLSSVTAPA